MDFPFETTTKDGRKATVLGKMPDGRLIGHIAREDGTFLSWDWDEDDTSTVVLKKPGQPEWVRDDDLVRFSTANDFEQAADFGRAWEWAIAFQIKRRPVLTPADPQLRALLAVATDDEADAIRSAARRANIEVPE